ncbi:hypothetical protein Lalb_Chr04g0257591 [Lupinus albus]|uniref:Uncharacterized protein n=1 Tax=Lupinus albus TaxID=3870 RepID=A0A6A4QNQ6_LUPAL|nr:hypothetical protein Lalb_Chr04g0257591 [Lupinus albus]
MGIKSFVEITYFVWRLLRDRVPTLEAMICRFTYSRQLLYNWLAYGIALLQDTPSHSNMHMGLSPKKKKRCRSSFG